MTLNPLLASDQISHTVSGLIFRGLTRYRADLTLTGDLAAGWRVEAEGRRLIFFLRRGVKWHDGREFTAQDVLFTYQQLTSGALPTPLAGQFGPVRQVTALDDYTVQVDYIEPFGPALESWSIGLLPRHLFEDRTAADPAFGRQPVGTGPYRLAAWLPGQWITLEAFPEFYGGAPRLPRLQLWFLADAATRLLQLKAGRLHVMELSPAQYAAIRRQPAAWPRLALPRCPGTRYGFLGFNLERPRWQDPRLRLALSQAIDREAILRTVLQGLGRLTASPYPPDTYYFHPRLPPPAFAPAQARQTLQALGVLPWPQDQPLVLNTNYENRDQLAIAEIIQQNFAALGLPVQIRTYDWVTFRHLIINRRDFDLVLLSRSYLPDPDLYPLWHSSQSFRGGWNFLAYRQPEVDRLLEAGRRLLDPERRRQLYFRLQEVMAAEPPCLFLYAADTVYAAPVELQGLQPGPLDLFHNLEEWFWAGNPSR